MLDTSLPFNSLLREGCFELTPMDFVNPPKISSQIVHEPLVEKRAVLRFEALAQEQFAQLNRVIPIEPSPWHPRRGVQLKDKAVDQRSGDVEPRTIEFSIDSLKDLERIERLPLRDVSDLIVEQFQATRYHLLENLAVDRIMRETTINGEDGWQWICSRKISNPIQKSTNSFFVFFGSHMYPAVPCLKDDVPDIRCIDEMFRELLASESKAGLVPHQLAKVPCNPHGIS